MSIFSAGPHVQVFNVFQNVFVDTHIYVGVHRVPGVLRPNGIVGVVVLVGKFVDTLVDCCVQVQGFDIAVDVDWLGVDLDGKLEHGVYREIDAPEDAECMNAWQQQRVDKDEVSPCESVLVVRRFAGWLIGFAAPNLHLIADICPSIIQQLL